MIFLILMCSNESSMKKKSKICYESKYLVFSVGVWNGSYLYSRHRTDKKIYLHNRNSEASLAKSVIDSFIL